MIWHSLGEGIFRATCLPDWYQKSWWAFTAIGSILLATTAQAGELDADNNLEFQLQLQTDDWQPTLQLDYRRGNTNYGSNIHINDRGNLNFGFDIERVQENIRYGGKIGIDVEGNWQVKTKFGEEAEELAYETVLLLETGENTAGFLNLNNLQWSFDVESTWRGENHEFIWNSSLNHQGQVDGSWEAEYSDETARFSGTLNGDRFQGTWESVEENREYSGELVVDFGDSWKLQTNLEGTEDNLSYSGSFILSSGSDRQVAWQLSWEGEYQEVHGEAEDRNTRLHWTTDLGNAAGFTSEFLAEYTAPYSSIEGSFHLHSADWKMKGKTQLVREENTTVRLGGEVGSQRGYQLQARGLREDSRNKLESTIQLTNGEWAIEKQITYADQDTNIDFLANLEAAGSWEVKLEREADKEYPDFPGTFAYEASQEAGNQQGFTMDTDWEIPAAMGHFSPLSPSISSE
ncbi:hypothetical protein [Geitlerinema sp. PCC 9228]|jgi:hypothetical protein|uniref:hypothetical protein n=1 Tax=Geitlerinema sp. PCC 9228 TaxID=111611 RepID=UPI001114E3BE|nr:hypothetical protein [Geitlerinema sp. PCC 9228]